MDNKKRTFGIIVAVGVIAALLAAGSAGTGLSQEEYNVVGASNAGTGINYQGMLTDSGGNPLDGTYEMTFSLYEVPSGGTALDTDTNSVEVENGLFNTEIDFNQWYFDGRALWLGITVGTDSEMTPRQELRPVPYALSLVPGAGIVGDTSGPILRVENKGSWGTGVLVETTSWYGYGVLASTAGTDSPGFIAYTESDGSPGVLIVTDGNYSYGVNAYTEGDNSAGIAASTEGTDSEAVHASTWGDNSEGVYAETYGRTSDGVDAHTEGDWSNGFYAHTEGDYSTGVDAHTYGDHSTGVSVATYGDYSYGVWAFSEKSVGVRGSGKTYDFYAAGPGTNYGPFTGAHEVKLSADFPENVTPGMIVSVTGETQVRQIDVRNISFSSTLPTVQLSDTPDNSKVLGVLISESPLPEEHWYINESNEGDRFGIVNALGEGRVWVTDINGDIEAGDYITTSLVAGYGQKQDDDLLHSYTLGKAIGSVNWSKLTTTVEFNGQTYKAYPIAVVYTSG